ncbi:hypothetical protein LQ327_05620 [Actinomycetospora endophytica]|uniref:Lipoprotein n=1 Tax=Actinomycetospora endophytica TaxID=2291215 RepID=A0ABS8P3N8_9PSEU|nr:hypothetical protein [Actinomycetospora endophytica]MCD2192865.1 hypothetical protein [Actinomycetospora endophytica]
MRGGRGTALVVGTLLVAAVTAGCGTVVPGQARVAPVARGDRALIDQYIASANHAGDAGPTVQTAFLRATQAQGAPFPPDRCFGNMTLQTDLVGRTLRPDPGWKPPETQPNTPAPAGAIYVVAAAVSVRQGQLEIREDVGSKHFVIHDGRVTGYAPCAD